MKVGQPTHKDGFFTKALYLRSKTTDRLEDLLGYGRGRLGQGWWLLFLLEMPRPAEFDFRGYSHFSDGVEQGHLDVPPDPRTMEERLGDDGYDLVRLKQKTIANTFRLDGPERLAKVIPAAWGNAYPPGLGVPQWRLNVAKKFIVRAFIKPGETYLGDYS